LDKAEIATYVVFPSRPKLLEVWPDLVHHAALNLGSEASGEAGDLRLRDAVHPHRLHEVVDAFRRDSFHTGLADHGHEGLLDASARRQEELGRLDALAQLRDGEIDRTDPRVPGAVAVAAAEVLPLLLCARRSGRCTASRPLRS